MRKLILLFALLIGVVAFTAAQDFTIYKPGVTAFIPLDTITNTGTDNAVALLKIPRGEAWGLSCLMFSTTISGTLDIDVNYESSIDGTNYYTVASDSLATDNVAYIHEDVDGFSGRYFRVTYTGVGTQSSSVKGDLYVFKLPQ